MLLCCLRSSVLEVRKGPKGAQIGVKLEAWVRPRVTNVCKTLLPALCVCVCLCVWVEVSDKPCVRSNTFPCPLPSLTATMFMLCVIKWQLMPCGVGCLKGSPDLWPGPSSTYIVFAIYYAFIANSCGHVQYLMCTNNTRPATRSTVLCLALG